MSCPKRALGYVNLLVRKDTHKQGVAFLQSIASSFCAAVPRGSISRERFAKRRRVERYIPLRATLHAEAAKVREAERAKREKERKQQDEEDDGEEEDSFEPDYGDDGISAEKEEVEEKS